MKEHPAGEHLGVGRCAVWYGTEVEGAACHGRPTVFMDSWPVAEIVRDIRGRLEWREITHIFLTENFEDFEKFAAVFTSDLLVGQDIAVTIGTTPDRIQRLLALPWTGNTRLMVRADMDAPWITSLRPHDQVSVGEPYNLMTWSVSDAVHTVPSNYLKDKA